MALLTFGYPQDRAKEKPAAHDNVIASALIRRFSEGNVSLHLGAYITEGDVDRLREDILKHNFLGGKK